ncbi:related to oxidase [Phialocephala subalpina]|uniref:Related to oxidase n=1 Tax=Phialocephala subalpina TaxID=576137 RepID=A0A1L7WPH6_9HELO|nr:related to oxidase [Phialocephala subalpina]
MKCSSTFFSFCVLLCPSLPFISGFSIPQNTQNPSRLLSSRNPPTPYDALRERVSHLLDKRTISNTTRTPIEVTGDHTFIPPDFENGAQRGPCPGLNALANHGYISRDGIVGRKMAEVIAAINEVYGMSIVLATVLGVMGVVDVGNPLSLNPSFSIGGKSDQVHNLLDDLSGVVGTPRGLDGSHNFIEADSSNTRNDLYQTGDAWTMNMTLFMQAYDATDSDFITMDDIGQRAADRFADSIATNPLFYYGPYTGLVARNAGYAFAGRLLANHTSEHPEGLLRANTSKAKEVFKSFFGVFGEEGSFEYKFGWEQIPQNWYKIPVEYGLVELNLDLINWVTQHPELASVGGNTGEVNSFVGLDLANVTGGILSAERLLEDNNLLCFALEIVKTFSPNSLSPLFATLAVPLGLVMDATSAPILSLACPAFADMMMDGKPLWEGLFGQFPGAAKSGSAM